MSGGISTLLAQLRLALQEPAQNLQTMSREVVEHADANLIVFPELFLSGYTTREPGELVMDLEEAEDVYAIARLAGENSTAAIFAPERVSGGIANSAICVDRSGNIAGSYRKMHLFGAERMSSSPGTSSWSSTSRVTGPGL